MSNFVIDWKNLTETEAQEIIENISASFNIVAKSVKDSKFHDVFYLIVDGVYDDNRHAYKYEVVK